VSPGIDRSFWSEAHYQAGVKRREADGILQDNPEIRNTHESHSWRAGFEAKDKEIRQSWRMKQHEHLCPRCKIPFLCRGKACEGKGPDLPKPDESDDLTKPVEGDVHCEYCWLSMAD
jgi:hypothetical protein